MVIGAGVERVVEQAAGNKTPHQPAAQGPTPNPSIPPSLISKGTPTAWFFVTTVADLGSNAIRFATDTIVQWQGADRKFHCPCHGRRFTEYGKIDHTGPGYYVYPLPRLETKVVDGEIYVKVPMGPGPRGWEPGEI